ncbi:hypothetical protein [Roseovarius sp. THAF8]|uniref:hypothetical protein n=1 Tax=Roseovarius sp. THAF8 TaxID=2587846 RepID=UPI001562DCBC
MPKAFSKLLASAPNRHTLVIAKDYDLSGVLDRVIAPSRYLAPEPLTPHDPLDVPHAASDNAAIPRRFRVEDLPHPKVRGQQKTKL